jgi:hypothetical protein
MRALALLLVPVLASASAAAQSRPSSLTRPSLSSAPAVSMPVAAGGCVNPLRRR